MPDYSLDTLAIHSGEGPDQQTGALAPPIHMSSTFRLPELGPPLDDALAMKSPRGPYVYVRWDNPTARTLEDKISALEGGEAALALSSGMAAVSAIPFTFLSQGDHLVASMVCYAGSATLFANHLTRQGIEITLADTSDLTQVRAALQPNTKLVYVETPANPILILSDLQALAEIAHQAGALLVVDSTWAGPCLQRPLELGADFVLHSATKYLNGHGDALGGLIVGSAEGVHRIRKEALVHLGGAPSPFNAWLIARGITTLPLRMARHCENALTVARFLEGHPAVSRVIYPGLESHPQHDLARRQMSAFGGMVAFQLRGGLAAARKLVESTRLFSYATSLGDARSLMCYYTAQRHVDSVAYLSQAHKARIREWMGDGIVRASIGLEDTDDLIADLDQALRE